MFCGLAVHAVSDEQPKKYSAAAAALAKRVGKAAPKSPTAQLREEQELRRRAKTERIERAKSMYANGVAKTRIAEELQTHYDTVCRWLKNEPKPVKEEVVDEFAHHLDSTTEKVVADARLAARDAEEKALMEVAENQSSPADKYQAYVAASAIKMLRDNLVNIRGPRTVRELSELDQLIRRNLGLNPKNGSGSGSLTIDISILNNAKAANGGADVIVEAEEV